MGEAKLVSSLEPHLGAPEGSFFKLSVVREDVAVLFFPNWIVWEGGSIISRRCGPREATVCEVPLVFGKLLALENFKLSKHALVFKVNPNAVDVGLAVSACDTELVIHVCVVGPVILGLLKVGVDFDKTIRACEGDADLFTLFFGLEEAIRVFFTSHIA